jgi:hypothetical protein
MRRTFNDNPWDVSIGAIFLASKIEYEYTSRISRYLIHECARTAKKIADPNFELNRKQKEYGYWKNNMLYYETEILRVLYYDLNIDEPYSYSSKWCKENKVSIEEESIINYLLNESYIKTILCLQYPSKIIAAGAFVLATLNNKDIDWKKWKKNIDVSTNDIKDVSLKLKEMLIKTNEKSPSHYPHKYLSHKSFSTQDFVKSPSPLKISSLNNDFDKNNIDNKNVDNISITKSQLLSSPPKSDNSDHLEKDNHKNLKTSEDNIDDINIETKNLLNENEDWEVVDMDIDDDDDVIPNPNPNKNTNINTVIIENKKLEIKQENLNEINNNMYINDKNITNHISSNNTNNNSIKYDNYKSKNNYPYYSNSRKHYLPPPPSFHYSRSRSRGNNSYSYHYSYSKAYSNNYSNSGQNYYNRNNNSSYYRSSISRNIVNSKLSNPDNNNNNINNINNTSNINNVSPNQPGKPNYYPQY